MNITKNVINDLLPAYYSGEASSDTRAVIEDFLSNDPVFAETIEKQRHELANLKRLLQIDRLPLAKDHELRTLVQTKAVLERQKWSLAVALMFSAFPFSFVFEGRDLKFLLVRDQPVLAAIGWGLAAAFWVVFWRARSRANAAGF